MPKGVVTSSYDYLLEDKDFRRWYENVSRGSIATGHTWLRRVGFVHKKFHKTPRQIAAMPPKAAANFLLDIVGILEKEGKGGSYISNVIKPLKSWLDFNGKPVQQRIKIRGRDDLVRFADERPPTPDELRKIFNMADFRAKVACGIVAFSGVRLEILGDYLGTDGLKLKDFPELAMGRNSVEFEEIPTMITVRKALSKTGNQFFTFLCDEGCEYVAQYLEWRMRKGEQLTANSPLITPLQSTLVGEHIRTINIGDLMRKPIRAAGFQWRPYVLRRYFDTRLMIAESDGLIIKDYRTFFMGHSGDIEAVYTVQKALSQDVIGKMRESYRKAAEKYLTTAKKEGMTEERVVEKFNEQFLKMAGYGDEEISKMNLAELTPEQIQELVQKKSMQALGLNNGRQKIIPKNELRSYILDGWEFVTNLSENEAIVALPKD